MRIVQFYDLMNLQFRSIFYLSLNFHMNISKIAFSTLLTSSLVLFTNLNHVFAATIDPEFFQIGDTVTITGTGFGDPSIYNALCFNDEYHCILYGSSWITRWSNYSITFIMPQLVDENGNFDNKLSGFIRVYNDGTSVAQVNYNNQSTIFDTFVNGTSANWAYPGDTVKIQGILFGTTWGKVTLSDTDAEIISWGPEEITVKVPTPQRELLNIKELKIYRNKVEMPSYPFEVLVMQTGSNDPLSALQLYIEIAQIDKMWSTISPKEEIIVAVIDDGVYFNHVDLQGQLWSNSNEIIGDHIDNDHNGFIDDKYGWNFLNNSNDTDVTGAHGTTVAGIIAAIKNNNEGIAGINNKARIMPIIACDESGCSPEAVNQAIFYAVNNGARVINLSLGGPNITTYTTDHNDAIKYAWENGVVLVISAGNGDVTGGEGIDTTKYPLSPVCNDDSNYKMIIGVGASTKDNLYRTNWSNYGNCVDVYALGEGVVSTSSSTDFFYDMKDGTSFSAPIVSGIVSYILSTYPEMSNSAVYDFLTYNPDSQIINAKNIIDNLRKNYDSTKDFGNKWTSEIIGSTHNTEPTDIFSKDINLSPYKNAITYLKDLSVISGYPDGTYKPSNPINRAEFTKIVIGSIGLTPAGNNCFRDVTNEWFSEFICIAKIKNIINGYPDGSFQPGNNVNVAEALKITLNAFSVKVRDASNNEAWFVRYIDYAKENNLYLPSFNSESKELTRDEMAELIYRIMTNT